MQPLEMMMQSVYLKKSVHNFSEKTSGKNNCFYNIYFIIYYMDI